MVKVFRSFRQRFLNEGQGKKYFFYAIGEIFLVVVGILIALSINNWNKEKELRKAERKVYQNILSKINNDKNDIEANVIYNDDRMVQFHHADAIIESNDREQIDTLKVILRKLYEYSDVDVSNNIYQNLVNSGELKLLKNDTIILQLQELEEHYIYINRIESIHWQVILRYIGPGLIDNLHFKDLKVEKPDLLYTFDFQNLLFAMTNIMTEKEQVYNTTIGRIDMLSELIEQELNQ